MRQIRLRSSTATMGLKRTEWKINLVVGLQTARPGPNSDRDRKSATNGISWCSHTHARWSVACKQLHAEKGSVLPATAQGGRKWTPNIVLESRNLIWIGLRMDIMRIERTGRNWRWLRFRSVFQILPNTKPRINAVDKITLLSGYINPVATLIRRINKPCLIMQQFEMVRSSAASFPFCSTMRNTPSYRLLISQTVPVVCIVVRIAALSGRVRRQEYPRHNYRRKGILHHVICRKYHNYECSVGRNPPDGRLDFSGLHLHSGMGNCVSASRNVTTSQPRFAAYNFLRLTSDHITFPCRSGAPTCINPVLIFYLVKTQDVCIQRHGRNILCPRPLY